MAFWVTLLIYAAIFIATEFLKPKPNLENARPASIDEFSIPTATEGRHWPIVWGTNEITGANVIDYGDLRTVAVTEKVKTGMFSKKKIDVAFDYYMGIQFGLCLGPLDGPYDGIVKIRIDDDTVFDSDTLSSPKDPTDAVGDGPIVLTAAQLYGEDAGGVAGTLRIFPGTLTQARSDYLVSIHPDSPTQVPAYRGFSFAVGEQLYVGRAPNLRPWKFVIRRIPDALDLAADSPNTLLVNGQDANPMNVLYEILTDQDWGIGYSTSSINTQSFKDAAVTLGLEGNGFSMMVESPKEAISIIDEIQRQCDGILVQGTDGRWEFTLIRDVDISPVTDMPLVDENNGQVVDFSRGSWDETVNEVRVQFTNSQKEFVTNFAVAQDMANQIIQGSTVTATQAYPGVKNPSLANKLAWRDIRTLAYPLAKATIKVNRELYGARPGDRIRVTWAPFGIDQMVMRINKMSFGDLEDNRITVEAVQDVFGDLFSSFGDPEPTGWAPPSEDPTDLAVIDRFIFETPYIMNLTDPDTPTLLDRITGVARNTTGVGAEYEFMLRIKTSAFTGEAYVSQGLQPGYAVVGTLRENLEEWSSEAASQPPALGADSVEVDPIGGESLQDALIEGAATSSDIRNLLTLVYITPANVSSPDQDRDNGEFMIYTEAVVPTTSPQGAGVKLTGVYRGALDTTAKRWPAGSRVWFLGRSGATISVDAMAPGSGWRAQAKFLPASRSEGSLDEAAATATSQLLAATGSRARKPLSPVEFAVGGSRYPFTSVIGTSGITISWTRRNWRTEAPINSLLGNNDDGSAFVPGTTNTDLTKYNYTVRDVSGSPEESGAVSPNVIKTGSTTADAASNNEFELSRADVVTVTGGVPDRLRFEIEAENEVDSVARTSWDVLSSAMNVTIPTLSSSQFLGFIPYNTIASPQITLEESPGQVQMYFDLEDGPLDATGGGQNGKCLISVDDGSPSLEIFGIQSPMPTTSGPWEANSPSNWSTVRLNIQHFHNTGKRRLLLFKDGVGTVTAYAILVPNTEV